MKTKPEVYSGLSGKSPSWKESFELNQRYGKERCVPEWATPLGQKRPRLSKLKAGSKNVWTKGTVHVWKYLDYCNNIPVLSDEKEQIAETLWLSIIFHYSSSPRSYYSCKCETMFLGAFRKGAEPPSGQEKEGRRELDERIYKLASVDPELQPVSKFY